GQGGLGAFPSVDSGNNLPDSSFGAAPGGASDGQFPVASGASPDANTGGQLPAGFDSQLFPTDNANAQFPSNGAAGLNPANGSNEQPSNGNFGNQFPTDGSGGLIPGGGSNGQAPSNGIQFPSENGQQQQQPVGGQQTQLNNQPGATPVDAA
ncbi:hypothetical protein H4R20_007170, partial [Coemansia guatemalensis]